MSIDIVFESGNSTKQTDNLTTVSRNTGLSEKKADRNKTAGNDVAVTGAESVLPEKSEDGSLTENIPENNAAADTDKSVSAAENISGKDSVGEKRNIEPAVSGENNTVIGNDFTETDTYSRYFREIGRRIKEKLRYPVSARKRGIEGRVIVICEIDLEGKCVKIQVLEGSGFPVLDTAALDCISRVFPCVHGSGISFTMKIPVVFEID